MFENGLSTMTQITENRAAATLITGSTTKINNMSELSQHVKVAKTFDKKLTEQANTKVFNFKDI